MAVKPLVRRVMHQAQLRTLLDRRALRARLGLRHRQSGGRIQGQRQTGSNKRSAQAKDMENRKEFPAAHGARTRRFHYHHIDHAVPCRVGHVTDLCALDNPVAVGIICPREACD